MIVRAGLLGLVLLTAVLIETVVTSGLLVAGHAPAIVALTVVGVALADGSETAARYGFAAGLLLDLLGGGLLGMHAVVLVLTGWGVGATRPYLTGPPVLVRAVVGGAASALGVVGYGLLAFLLDPEAVTVAELLRSAVVTGLYSGVLAPFVTGPVVAVSRRAAVLGGTAAI